MSKLDETEHQQVFDLRDTIICCKQTAFADMKMADRNDGSATRGWEGDVPDNAQFPSIKYPMDELYLYTSPSYGAPYQCYPVPIQTSSDGRKYLDVCYSAEPGGPTGFTVYAQFGDLKIAVGPSFYALNCFLASTPNLINSLQPSTVTTPSANNPKATYEPFGDRLFKSEPFSINFNPYINQITNHTGRPISEVTSVQMKRATTVAIPALIVCDKYPPLDENGMPTQSGKAVLTREEFEARLGPAEDWSMRIFVAGKKGNDQNGVPIDYNLNSSENSVGAPIWDGQKGIVTLSEQIITFGEISKTAGTASYKEFTYSGIGGFESSYPFLFWSKDLSNLDVCFSIFYNGSDPEIKQTQLTLRCPLGGNSLPNNLDLKTFVIDIDDLEAAFKNKEVVPDPIFSRSNDITMDEDFGPTINIPTLAFGNNE